MTVSSQAEIHATVARTIGNMDPRIVAFIYGLVDRQFEALKQFIQPTILAFIPGGYVGSFARKVLARQAASHSFVQFRASVSAVYIYRTAKLFTQGVEQMCDEGIKVVHGLPRRCVVDSEPRGSCRCC